MVTTFPPGPVREASSAALNPVAAADLQHRVPGFRPQLFEHLGDEVRRGRGACRAAVGGSLGDHGVAAVSVLQRVLREELVAGHGAERLLDAGGLERSPAADPVGELIAQQRGPVLVCAVCGGCHGTDCSGAPGRPAEVERRARVRLAAEDGLAGGSGQEVLVGGGKRRDG